MNTISQYGYLQKTSRLSKHILSFVILLIFLLNLGSQTAKADDLICYRAQLHAHSTTEDGQKSPLAAWQDAYTAGLDVFALQGAEPMLTDAEWSMLATVASATSITGEYVPLRGFEWKYNYYADGTRGGDYGIGHLGIFNSLYFVHSPDYTSQGSAPTESQARNDLKSLYEWLATAVENDPNDGGVVAQFNHPSGDQGLIPSSRFFDFDLPWWIESSLRAAVIDRLALFEMGTGTTTYYGPYWYDPAGDGATNETLFKLALNQGWRVAPTVSEDSKKLVIPMTPHRTGIWAYDLSRAGIMEALHARRTFGSDDLDLQLSFAGNGEWMGSQLTVADASSVTFTANWYDPTDPIAAIWLVSSPGNETALDISGRNLYSDSVSFSTTVYGDTWYFIKLQEADGDVAFSAPIWIAPTQLLSVNAGLDTSILPGGTANLAAVASHGKAPYSYSWSPTAGLDDPTTAAPKATPSQTTTYTVTVTDAVGATAQDSVTVEVLTDGQVYGSGTYTDGSTGRRCNMSLNVRRRAGFLSGRISWYSTATRQNLIASNITSLHIASRVATITGSGTINGSGNYPFTLIVTDGVPDNWNITFTASGVTSTGNMTSGNLIILP